jgi:hypothetical protein
MEMPFEGAFVTQIIDDKWAMLKEPVIFKSPLFDDEFTSEIGFITDFASVPRVPVLYMFLGGRGKRIMVTYAKRSQNAGWISVSLRGYLPPSYMMPLKHM